MNSILINLSYMIIRADYNEFMIRLPSLCFFVLYLVGVGFALRNKQISLAELVFLISNYYLLEFYGLARGYGMANTCVFFACLSYKKWIRSGYQETKQLSWMMIYMSMAVFCNTIVLLLYPALGIMCLFRIYQTNLFKPFLKKSGIILFLFFLFTLIMIKYHLNISAEGKPLYTGGESGFFESVVKGYIKMLVPSNLATLITILIAAGTTSCFLLLNRDMLKNDFTMMLVLFIITNIGMQIALHKGYIATRVLLPFYSFVVLAYGEMGVACVNKLERNRIVKDSATFKNFRKTALTIVCILLIFSNFAQVNLHATKDWSGNYKYSTWVLSAMLTGKPYPESATWNATEEFYKQKYEDLEAHYLSQSNAGF